MIETLLQPTNLQDREQNYYYQRFSEIMGPISDQYSFGSVFTQELNIWQKTAARTHDIVTPANGIDAAGFAASMYGIRRLDSWRGIAAAGAGFLTDVIDGKVARATGTQSALGEAIDAGGDKVKLAYALYKIWQLDLAPKPLLTAVAIQNGLNAGLTTIDQITNKGHHELHPTQFGKKAIFLQEIGIGLHVIGSEITKTDEKRGRLTKLGGTAIGAAGVLVGGIATVGYTATLWKAHKRKKS